MRFKLILILIGASSSLFSSEAAKAFSSQANLYQGANFLNISNTLLVHKRNERSKTNQREHDNLVGISPVLLGNIVARLAKLENFQKEIEAKEASREKLVPRRVVNELGLLSNKILLNSIESVKNNTTEYLGLESKKVLDSEKNAELFSQVKSLCSRVEELTLCHKNLDDKLSIFNSNLVELVRSVQAEKAKKDLNSKRIAELSALRITDVATMSKKIEEFSARIAALSLQIDIKKGDDRLEFFSAETHSSDSLDSQDSLSGMPKNRVETRAQSSESTPNLSFL